MTTTPVQPDKWTAQDKEYPKRFRLFDKDREQARRAACSPALLEALEQATVAAENFERGDSLDHYWLNGAQDAIAKAEGRKGATMTTNPALASDPDRKVQAIRWAKAGAVLNPGITFSAIQGGRIYSYVAQQRKGTE